MYTSILDHGEVQLKLVIDVQLWTSNDWHTKQAGNHLVPTPLDLNYKPFKQVIK